MAYSSSVKLPVLSLSAVLLVSCGGASSSSSPISVPSSSSISSSTTISSSSEPSILSSASQVSSEATTEESSEVIESSKDESVSSEETSTEESSIEESSAEESAEELSSVESSAEESSTIESSEEVNRQIDAEVWKAIIEGGSMTDRNSNYTCTMTKSMKEIENVSTSTFYVSSGNLQRSMPASFNPDLIITEYYGLLEWDNPTSKYKHYTYNRADETWESEDLNSKFLHFYRDDLGIIIDLTLDDLTFDDANGYYYCKKKVSYPFDSPTINRLYENIKVQFNNGRLEQIQYDTQGAVFVFDYSSYDETVVTLPIIAG